MYLQQGKFERLQIYVELTAHQHLRYRTPGDGRLTLRALSFRKAARNTSFVRKWMDNVSVYDERRYENMVDTARS